MASTVVLIVLLSACGDGKGSAFLNLIDWDPTYTDQWAPAVGTELPELAVKDPEGDLREFSDLTGERGLLVFFVRSTNW